MAARLLQVEGGFVVVAGRLLFEETDTNLAHIAGGCSLDGDDKFRGHERLRIPGVRASIARKRRFRRE
jgi:hypothetical protein